MLLMPEEPSPQQSPTNPAWERVQLAYNALVHGEAERPPTWPVADLEHQTRDFDVRGHRWIKLS